MNANQIAILKQITSLTLDEQREINKALCDNMKRVSKFESMKVAAKFNVGDKVWFDARTKGIITVEITGFSRDGSKIKGKQINGLRAGCLWTASANLCNKA